MERWQRQETVNTCWLVYNFYLQGFRFLLTESLHLCRPSILDSCLLLSFWCVFHCLLMQFFIRWFTRFLEIYLGYKGLIVIWNLSNQQLLVAKILIPAFAHGGINVFHPNFEHHSGNCNLLLTFFLAPPRTLVVLPRLSAEVQLYFFIILSFSWDQWRDVLLLHQVFFSKLENRQLEMLRPWCNSKCDYPYVWWKRKTISQGLK